MEIIIGHSNMDLDCIAAIVLARKLHPNHVPVKSGTIHPVARNLYNLYETELNFLPAEDLAGARIDSIVMVDTRSHARVNEFLQIISPNGNENLPPITIYDHHPADSNDFPDARIVGGDYGSSATILGELVMEQGMDLSREEATIALAGIYSDTGKFTHPNVGALDFRVASWLLDQKASLRVVTSMVRSLRDVKQVDLFHEAMNHMVYQTIKGHLAGHFVLSLPKNKPGLAAIVERVFEVESPDVVIGLFEFEKPPGVLIVARSRSDRIPVNQIMAEFGGGGHLRASSAMIKEALSDQMTAQLWSAVEQRILPALSAADIMSSPVLTIPPTATLVDASMFLERVDHTGVPVVAESGELAGFLTLRDIMKGRKAGMMSAPVKGYMTQRVFTCRPTATLRDLESLFFTHNVGHLPVIDGDTLVGIVTRSDFLRVIRDPSDTAH